MNMHKTGWRLPAIIAAGIIAVSIIGFLLPRHLRSTEYACTQSGCIQIMGTFAKVTTVAADGNTASRCIAAAFEQLRLVDNLMSDYKPASELSKVNREAFDKPVAVGPQTFEVLQRSLAFSKASNGTFDITIGPLVDLWHKANDANLMPTSEEISAAEAKVGYKKLILDPNSRTIRFFVRGMRLDLGAVAKGYAVDLAIEAMKKVGAKGGLVEAGGDIKCFGLPPHGRDCWRIGVRDPAAPDDELLGRKTRFELKLSNAAVATSGNYYRYASVKGRHISHIIDPNTGLGAGQFSSVTVIAPDGTTADALATAVSVLGTERGKTFIESYPETSAIFIGGPPDYKAIFTEHSKRLLFEN